VAYLPYLLLIKDFETRRHARLYPAFTGVTGRRAEKGTSLRRATVEFFAVLINQQILTEIRHLLLATGHW